jgi:exopolysaccharide biosynthesis polyprenyl glycosylphosphotransferase
LPPELTQSSPPHAGQAPRHPDRRRGGRRATDPLVPQAPGTARATADLSPVWDLPSGPQALSDRAGLDALQRRAATLRWSLAAGDVVSAYLALAVAVLIAPGSAVHVRPAALGFAPVVVLVSKAIGLYDRDEHKLSKTTIDEAPSLLHLSVCLGLVVWLAQGIAVGGPMARSQVLALVATMLVVSLVIRALVRAGAVAVHPPERCMVLGSADDAHRTVETLLRCSAKARVVGRVPIVEAGSTTAANASALADLIARHAVERVIIAPDGHDQEAILHCIRVVKALGIKVSVVPRLLEVVGASAVFDELPGTTLLGVRPYGLSASSKLLKRTADIVVAGIGAVALAPLFAAISIAICLDSPGWPVFRQPRIGRDGRRFSILKFRSMVAGADALKEDYRGLNEAQGGLFKIGDDPRITRVGGLLRRLSLDELPQLLNVLAGDMSLVGPRPLVVDEDALIAGWQRRRLAVRPGMTGLWQIHGSSRIPLPDMVKIDYQYAANWSLWLDLKILLRTVPYVLSRRGL